MSRTQRLKIRDKVLAAERGTMIKERFGFVKLEPFPTNYDPANPYVVLCGRWDTRLPQAQANLVEVGQFATAEEAEAECRRLTFESERKGTS